MLMTIEAAEMATETLSSVPAVDQESEAKLTTEITALWSAHQKGKATAKRTKEELRELRCKLGEHLHAMKSLLVRAGRSGQWSSFLRERGIPRATGDRYVRVYEATLNPEPGNCLTEAISDPTEEAVKEVARRLLPRLQKVLTTKESLFFFVREVAAGITVAAAYICDHWVEVQRFGEEHSSAQVQEIDDAVPVAAVA